MRMRPYRSPKELFPLLIAGGADGRTATPYPICKFAFDGLAAAEVDRCVVVISESKHETIRVLSDGADYGVPLGYVVQPDPKGLTNVIACARKWIADDDVLFAMPDTVIFPTDALASLHHARKAAGADLMLGVFETDEPARLAPVEYEADGTVIAIHDKPDDPPVANTWGILSWSPAFTALCSDWDAARTSEAEGVLSHAMEAAREAGLDVRAHPIEGGIFRDVGTPKGLTETMHLLAERDLIFSTGS